MGYYAQHHGGGSTLVRRLLLVFLTLFCISPLSASDDPGPCNGGLESERSAEQKSLPSLLGSEGPEAKPLGPAIEDTLDKITDADLDRTAESPDSTEPSLQDLGNQVAASLDASAELCHSNEDTCFVETAARQNRGLFREYIDLLKFRGIRQGLKSGDPVALLNLAKKLLIVITNQWFGWYTSNKLNPGAPRRYIDWWAHTTTMISVQVETAAQHTDVAENIEVSSFKELLQYLPNFNVRHWSAKHRSLVRNRFIGFARLLPFEIVSLCFWRSFENLVRWKYQPLAQNYLGDTITMLICGFYWNTRFALWDSDFELRTLPAMRRLTSASFRARYAEIKNRYVSATHEAEAQATEAPVSDSGNILARSFRACATKVSEACTAIQNFARVVSSPEGRRLMRSADFGKAILGFSIEWVGWRGVLVYADALIYFLVRDHFAPWTAHHLTDGLHAVFRFFSGS